ncbi:MAG: TraR/DksA family transcriptional regulator [Planctomycetota bacterium]
MAKKTSSKKSATKKASAKKKAASKPRATTKKPVKKKAAASAKPSSKKTAKTAAKTTPKKTTTKDASANKKKATSKKPPASKAASKTAAAPTKPAKEAAPKKSISPKSKEAAKPAPAAEEAKPQRKGITIVSKKPVRKSPAKKTIVRPDIPGGSILGPGRKPPKPLIPSGPGAKPLNTDEDEGPKSRRKKSPLTKKQIEMFDEVLRKKRAALLGDLENMEGEALKSGSGSLSNTPQHLADQGSDAYDQSLSLDLADYDRKLIREIDAALERIAASTYGLCEKTNQPIPLERLEELPWTRYTIEGARLAERSAGGGA